MAVDYATSLSRATSEGFRLIDLDPPSAPALDAGSLASTLSDTPDSSFPPVPLSRLVAVLIAEGKGPDQISAYLNLPEDKVRFLIKSPEVSSILNNLPQIDQTRLVESVLQSTVIDSILLLQEIRDNPEATPTNRLAAAKELLDRALGRPEAISKSKPLRNSEDDLPTDPTERARFLSAQIDSLLPNVLPAAKSA